MAHPRANPQEKKPGRGADDRFLSSAFFGELAGH
jgi:hypothetical protein